MVGEQQPWVTDREEESAEEFGEFEEEGGAAESDGMQFEDAEVDDNR